MMTSEVVYEATAEALTNNGAKSEYALIRVNQNRARQWKRKMIKGDEEEIPAGTQLAPRFLRKGKQPATAREYSYRSRHHCRQQR